MTASTSQRAGLFLRIGEFAARRKGFVFLVTTLLVFLAVVISTRLHLDTDILTLVPRGNAKVDAFKASLDDFGGIDYLPVLLEAPPGRSMEDYEEFADALADRLADIPGVQSVEYRAGGNDALLALFRKHALLFVPPAEIPALTKKLSERGIRDSLAEDLRILQSPSSQFLKELVKRDPLGLGRMVLGRLLAGRSVLKVSAVDGYYMSEDGQALLILVKPARPAQNLGYTAQLVAKIHQAEAEARAASAKDEQNLDGLAVSYGGAYVATLEDSNLIRTDMQMTGVLSFVGVLGLYVIGYRRMGALFYSSVPLMVGQAFTFALAALVLGRLNSASSGFIAMLMGLGTDFTIVMYARYVEERQSGQDLEEAIRRMMGEATLGVFTGAITSAGTFYAMCTTEFLGLRELGFLLGSGILLCLAAIVFLLPAMIQWNEGRAGQKITPERLHVQSFGFERMIPFAIRHRKVTLLASTLIVAGLAVAGWNVGFSDNLRDLRSKNNTGSLVSEKVAKKFGGNLNVMMAIIEAPDLEGALEKMRGVQERLAPFVTDGTVSGSDSLLNYLPPASAQEAILAALAKGRERADGPLSFPRVEAALRAEAEAKGFRAEAFDDYLVELKQMMDVDRPVGVDALKGKELGSLLGRYIKEKPSGYRAAVYLYLDSAKWRREVPPGISEALSGGDPAITITGVNVVSSELRRIFLRDSKRAVAIGILLVTVLLILDLQSFKLAMLANAQVLGGIVMMLGCMSLLGIEMNFVNAFTATMILGSGVDYGIHIIHRMRASGGKLDGGLMETGKAVGMAALTNVAGFGSLCFSSFPGMRSVGVVAVLGTVNCLLTALLFLPAALAAPEAVADAVPAGVREGAR
ncbi:MAG: MMPL family transporter [Acidobacteria bacterium]|nr:MMPL family transporter [Acidobacteriota bacterium]